VINGTEIRAARERAGLTQGELATRVGVSLRTVGNWERGETVPQNRASVVEQVLAEWIDANTPGPRLVTASDAELLAEIARRFERSSSRDGRGPRIDLHHGGTNVEVSNVRSISSGTTVQDRYDEIHDQLDRGELDDEPYAAGTGDDQDVEQPGPEDDEGR
jgi:transcriptional regulator with XRE-family HTH domain